MALLCLFSSISSAQTFEPIDVLDWSMQVGLSGFTSAGTTWDATGNENLDCDNSGFYGIQSGAFVINDWEGTCGCDCGPDDPSTCGQNDSNMDIILAPAAISAYCQLRVSIPISTSGNLECGTNNDQDPNDITTDQCLDNLGAWAGTDLMIIRYDVLLSDGSNVIETENICGENGAGVIEKTFVDAQFVRITITGGTQEADEFYEIGNISVEGVIKEIPSLSIFAINHDPGYICENSSLPLILQTNADPDFTFFWTGPNSFVSNDVRLQFTDLDPSLSGNYSVQVTDNNGCIASATITITVKDEVDADCTSSPEFSLFGIVCSDVVLPSVSDNGISGSWSPGADLSQFAGQTLDFTFIPDANNVSDFTINLQVDDLDRLDDFAIQPDPTPVFCNESSTRYDLIQMFQMNLDLSLTVNGEEDIFFFIDNNETVQQVEAQMRSISFQGITPGEKTFFIDAVSPCGEVNQLSYSFVVLGATEPVKIDTSLCEGEIFTYLGIPITRDTVMNDGECGGGIEIDITYLSPSERRSPLIGSYCITDKVYVYDTIDADGEWIGITTEFLEEYEDAIDTIFTQSYVGKYTLPFPASNGCDSIVNLNYTFPAQDKVNRIEFDLCENEEVFITASERDWRVSAATPYYEIQISCDSSVVINANILPTEIDSITSTFCAGQDTLIENFNGEMILFDRDHPSETFLSAAGPNGCSASIVVDLTFIEPATSEINETICLGESVVVGTEVFTTTTIDQVVVLSGQAASGCDSLVTVNVQLIDAAIEPGLITCDNSEIQLELTHNGTVIGWSGPNGFTSTSESPTVSEPGLYTVTVEGPNGCQSEFSQNITQDIIPPVAEAFGGEINCNSNGEITLSYTSDGTFVEWTGPEGFSSTEEAPTISVAGEYFVEVVGSNGCNNLVSVMVTEDLTEPAGIVEGGILNCANNSELSLNLTTTDILVGWSGPDDFSSTDITPLVTAPGTYIATIRKENGCEVTLEAIVTEDITLPTVETSNDVLTCLNDSSVILIATTTDEIISWVGPNNFSSTEASPTINEVGTYTVTVRGVNGCETLQDIEITADFDQVEVTVENITLDCNNPAMNLIAQTDGTILSWAGPSDFSSTEESPSVSEPGEYFVTVIGTNGCESIVPVEVTLNDTLPTSEGGDILINCGETEVALSITTDAQVISWTGPEGFTSTDISPLASIAGEYQVEIVGANGCSILDTINLIENNIEPEASALGGELNCINNGELQLTLTTTDSLVGWTGPNGFSSEELEPTITEAGTYQATIVSNEGCSVVVEAIVVENNIDPVVTTENVIISCSDNGMIQISAQTDDNILGWTGPGGFTSTEAAPMVSEAGTYIVTVQGINGCELTSEVIVSQDVDLVEITTTDGELSCDISEFVLSANTTGTILGWSGPNDFSSTEESPTVTDAGSYTVTVLGDNGCENTSTLLLSENSELPIVTVENQNIGCGAGEVVINATTVETIVGWVGPNGFTSSDANPTITESGEYTVTVIGANGCENTATLTVTEDNTVPTLSVSDTTLNCNNDMRINLVANTDGSVIEWTGPGGFVSNEASPEIDFPGDYIVTVEGASGCNISATVTVTEDIIAPVVSTNNEQLSCTNNASVNLEFESTEGQFLRWEGPAGFMSTEQNPSIQIPGSYEVFVIGANGCVNSTTSVISGAADIPTAEVSASGLITCEDTEVELVVTSTADVVSWETPDGSVIDGANPVVTIAGTYIVTVADQTGCQGFASIEVLEDIDQPEVTIPQVGLGCENTSAVLSATTNGEIRGWRGPNNFVSLEESPTISEPGTYEVEVIGSNGCVTVQTIEITNDSSAPTLDLSTEGDIACESAGAQLRINTDGTIVGWTGPNGFTSDIAEPEVFESGTYEAIVTGTNGCTTTENIDINFTGFSVEVGGVIGSCEGVANGMFVIQNVSGATPPFILTGIGADPIEITSLPYVVEGMSAGDYEISVSIPDGCSDNALVTITEEREGALSIDALTIDAQGEFDLSLEYDGEIQDIVWSNTDGLSCTDCPNPMVSIDQTTTYTVQVTDSDGCISNAEITLSLSEIEKIYVPNIMNSRSLSGNNRFYPQGNFDQNSTYDMMIFDRWGNKVFETKGAILNDPNSGWNGEFNGMMANSGVYVYSITIYNELGNTKTIKGDLTFVR